MSRASCCLCDSVHECSGCPCPAWCEKASGPRCRHRNKLDANTKLTCSSCADSGGNIQCDAGGNRYSKADCLNELTLCKVNLALCGLFVIFAVLALIPLMVMCCCAKKPVRA